MIVYMGIRIHKVMGYGITDLQTHKGYITDPRFNLQSVPFLNWDDDSEEPEDDLEDATGYFKYIEALRKNRREGATMLDLGYDYYTLKRDLGKKHSVLSSIVFNFEMGSPNTLCLVPVGQQDSWMRYDDPIDYEEEFIRSSKKKSKNADLKPRVDLIPKDNLYPYSEYDDIRTGERVKDENLRTVRSMIELNLIEGEQLDSFINSQLGIASYEEFKQYIVPRTPQDLVDLVNYTKLLTDIKYIRDFKPMIYSYWS
jgi:hypothetical protein